MLPVFWRHDFSLKYGQNLEAIIPTNAVSEIQILLLPDLSRLYGVFFGCKNSEKRFSHDMAYLILLVATNYTTLDFWPKYIIFCLFSMSSGRVFLV